MKMWHKVHTKRNSTKDVKPNFENMYTLKKKQQERRIELKLSNMKIKSETNFIKIHIKSAINAPVHVMTFF